MHLKTLIFVIAVACGIVIGEKFALASDVAIFSLFLFAAQLIFFLFWKRKNIKVNVCLLTLLASLGLFLGIIRNQLVEAPQIFTCEGKCQFEGVVEISPLQKDVYQEVVVKVLRNDCANCANVLIKAPLYPKFSVGEKLVLTGAVSEPENILPTEVNEKGFDYKNYLLTKNIGSTSYYPKIESKGLHDISFQSKLISLKDDFVSRLNKYTTLPASWLGSGMLFGSADFTKELNEVFRVAGISHIVVLSGFNIAILISSVLALLFFLPLFVRIFVSVVFVILFVLAVGAESSVIRATIMAFISLLAMMSGREYVAKQALIISFLLVILYDPISLLNSASLHLSFLATAGIVYLSGSVGEVLNKIKIKGVLNQVFTATISAILATQGYVLYTFGFLSLYSFVVNILVVPFVPLAMLLSFLVVITSYLSEILANIFGFVDSVLLNGIIGVAKFFSTLPFAKLDVSFSLTFAIIYYFVLFAVFYFYKNSESLFMKREIKSGEINEEIYKF